MAEPEEADDASTTCSNCGEAAPEGAVWCEACGHELAVEAGPPCTACGEREVSPEGYCLSCGHRQPAERDHQRFSVGPVVAVTDRGRRHHHNEDSVAIGFVDAPAGGRPAVVLVVCDGVSSTAGSAEASAGAAAVARDVLMAGLEAEPQPVEVGPLLVEAVDAAQAVASDVVAPPDGLTSAIDDGPPSSTLVAVVARPEGARADRHAEVDDHAGVDVVELTTAWVGDSRAYWVGAGRAERLTGADHELGGGLSRWLGADSMDPTPDIESVVVEGPGRVVACSDGLWRYAAEPEALAALLARLEDGRSGADLAVALVDHANEQGGHDNISVALWPDRPDRPWGRGPVTVPSEGQADGSAEGSTEGSTDGPASSTAPAAVPAGGSFGAAQEGDQ